MVIERGATQIACGTRISAIRVLVIVGDAYRLKEQTGRHDDKRPSAETVVHICPRSVQTATCTHRVTPPPQT